MRFYRQDAKAARKGLKNNSKPKTKTFGSRRKTDSQAQLRFACVLGALGVLAVNDSGC
jgi:hypothetical protein